MPDMPYVIVPVLSLLVIWFLAGAALPFTTLAERRRAVTRRRSLYEKSADQVEALTCLMQAALTLAVAVDLLAGGLVSHLVPGPWRLIGWLAVAGMALGALFSLLGRSLRRCGRGSCAPTWLSGLCATVAAVCAVGIFWAFLRGVGLEKDGLPEVIILNLARVVRISVIQSADAALTGLFGLTCAALAPAAALGAGLVWQALRRGADDFGRDYYTVTMGNRARLASYAGALLLFFSALLMWVTPAFSPARLALLLPFVPADAEAARAGVWLSGIACLSLPGAVLCWYLIARSAVPLRRKTLIFLAPLLLWLGVCGLLARLWL